MFHNEQLGYTLHIHKIIPCVISYVCVGTLPMCCIMFDCLYCLKTSDGSGTWQMGFFNGIRAQCLTGVPLDAPWGAFGAPPRPFTCPSQSPQECNIWGHFGSYWHPCQRESGKIMSQHCFKTAELSPKQLCYLHVTFMLHSCYAHVTLMLHSCPSLAPHLLFTCYSLATHLLLTCRSLTAHWPRAGHQGLNNYEKRLKGVCW